MLPELHYHLWVLIDTGKNFEIFLPVYTPCGYLTVHLLLNNQQLPVSLQAL